MIRFPLNQVILGLMLLVTIASSYTINQRARLPLPSRILNQFPKGTWIENIAVRRNGALLLTTLIPNASLYQLSNPTSSDPCISLVHTFPEVSGLIGITETSPDVFVVAGGNSSSAEPVVKGTATTFSIDFNGHRPVVKTIAVIHEASIPNGLTSLPHHRTTVLISDTAEGLVWRLDTLTGEYDVGMQTAEMGSPPDAAAPAGINGLHIFQGDLYFVNSHLATIYRVKITPSGSIAPHASVEAVAKLDAVFLDDFAIAVDGTIYAATNADNRVIAVKPDGKGGYGEGVVVEGSVTSLTVAGDTAAAFGRTGSDRNVLYVVTSGALSNPVNGTVTEGGKVVAIDTRGY